MPENQQVSQFTAAIRKRLNLHRTWTIMLWSALTAGLCMLVVALIYVVPGYAVPWPAYLVIGGMVFLVAAMTILLGRKTDDVGRPVR